MEIGQYACSIQRRMEELTAQSFKSHSSQSTMLQCLVPYSKCDNIYSIPTPQSRSEVHLCRRASNRSCERAALNVCAREEPVFGTRSIVTLAGQTKNTKMPVGAVGRSAGGERSSSLGERAVAGGVPEGDLVLGVDIKSQYVLKVTL